MHVMYTGKSEKYTLFWSLICTFYFDTFVKHEIYQMLIITNNMKNCE